MIANFIILNLIFSSLLRPEMLIQDTYYPSGNKEADKVYPSDKPARQYPLLNLDTAVYDSDFNKLEPGIYSVEYSPEFNTLLISDRHNTISAAVFQVIKLNQKVHIPSAKVAFIKDDRAFIIYKNQNLEVHGFLYLPKAVLEGN